MKKQKTSCKVFSHDKIIEDIERKDRAREKDAKIYTIFQGIAKNLCLCGTLKILKIKELEMKTELCEFLSEGLINNNSLTGLIINHSVFTNESFEMLGKGLLGHRAIECLDLSNNALDNKYGNMISRIIIRQTQRRDQVIWMHGLRNEKPLNNDYARGLIHLNLSNNQLSDSSADEISNALMYDSYIRSIDLKNNKISEEGCKMFVKILRRNLTILNLDLRGNHGYKLEENLHKRLVIKLAKNIKNLHKQYTEAVFDRDEYIFLKKYVNYDFFDVEVPQHIVQIYSDGNCNSNPDMKLNDCVKTVENSDQFETANNNQDLEGDAIFSSENRMSCENETESLKDVSEENFKFNTDRQVDPSYDKEKKNINNRLYKLKQHNRNLFRENLQLRKNILTLRAKLLENRENEGSSTNSKNRNEKN